MEADSAVPTTAPPASGYGQFLTQVLSDREQFFIDIVEGRDLGLKLAYASGTLLGLCALYGAAAGAYAGPLQSLSAAIKLPLLFVGTLLICFPAFFVIQVLLGSRLRFMQVLTLVVTSLALCAVLLAAVVPVSAFFLLTGANYHFLELLHTSIVLGAGLFGMAMLHEGLAYACEKKGVYPRQAMSIMKAWAILFAFVGVQMAWNLRPFVGDRGQPFKVFRHYEGNFYTAIIYSVRKLAHGEGQATAKAPSAPTPSLMDVPHPLQLGRPVPDSANAGGR